MSKAIIDADSYLYKAALTCKELVEIQPGVFYEAYNLNTAQKYLKDEFARLTIRCGCDEYMLVVGGIGKNFRLALNPNYKANRKKQAKPLMLDKVREMVFKEFPVCYFPSLEADDTCRILMEEDKDNVVVSVDKDLRTFPGKVYDSYHDEVKYITPLQAEANFKRQLLIGDKTDGYAGLPKVGPATANKLLLKGITEDDIAQMYIDAGLGIEAFESVYNCAKILGRDDYNNGVVKLYGGKTLDLANYQ